MGVAPGEKQTKIGCLPMVGTGVAVLAASLLTCGWDAGAKAAGGSWMPVKRPGCMATVPDTIGQGKDSAYSELTSAGFFVPPMLVSGSGAVVVQTIPNPGAQVNRCINNAVTVYLGDVQP